MSEVGADVYHRDWGWWDARVIGMVPISRPWAPICANTAWASSFTLSSIPLTPNRRLRENIPIGWLKETLDMSKPEVVEYLEKQLDEFRERFGPFEWRNDSTPTVPIGGDTPILGQDQGFREIIRHFLDKHPDALSRRKWRRK